MVKKEVIRIQKGKGVIRNEICMAHGVNYYDTAYIYHGGRSYISCFTFSGGLYIFFGFLISRTPGCHHKLSVKKRLGFCTDTAELL